MFGVAEGETVEVAPAREAPRPPARHPRPERSALLQPLAEGFTILLAAEDGPAADAIYEAARADDIRVLTARTPADALEAVQERRPSMALVQRSPTDGDLDGLALCRTLRRSGTGSTEELPIVVVAEEAEVDPGLGREAGVTDWLSWPFSTQYARTRTRAWCLRRACRWEAAPLPEDEEERLGAVRGLGLLDSAAEERFDRLTRLAQALFDVSAALINLVDADRQWTKSGAGSYEIIPARNVSFCSHVIHRAELLHLSDTLRDPQFADNPMVSGAHPVRFYAGVPLCGPSGHPVCTLLLLDDRPRSLNEAQRRLLWDLAKLTEAELARPASR